MNLPTVPPRLWRILALGAALAAPVFAALPVITKHPAPASVTPGGAVLISVTITTDSAASFQWRRNGVALPQETEAAIELEMITANQLGDYDVVITNATGSVTSNAATLAFSSAANTWMADGDFAMPEFTRTVLPGRVTRGATSGKFYITRGASILVDGQNGTQVGPLIRLNADGTRDNSFHGVQDLADAWAVMELPSGQILVGGVSTEESAIFREPLYRVFRLNAGGSIDESYQSPVFGNIPRFMTLQPDGKLLVVPSSGTVTNGGIPILARLNADGSLDGSFTQPGLSAGGAIFAPPVLDAAGKIYIGGIFSTVNGSARPCVARLNANGTLDTGYVPSGVTVNAGTQVRGLAVQTQGGNAGKLLVAGGPMFVPGSASPATSRPVVRLNTDGSVDNSFTLLTQEDVLSPVRPRLLNLLANDSFTVVSAGVTKFDANGTVNAVYARPTFSLESFWMETLADGSVLVNPEPGSTITTAAGTINASTLVKFTPAGALDATFTPGFFQNQIYPTRAAILSTGKLFVWGPYDRTNGSTRVGATRFNADGSVDSGYTLSGLPDLLGITSGNVASDDRLLATVLQGAEQSVATTSVARFTSTGALDATFTLDPSISGEAGLQVFQLPDNRALGWAISPQRLVNNSAGFTRLLASGTIDNTFVGLGSASFGGVFRDGTNAVTGITMGTFRIVGVYPDGRMLAIATKGPYTANPSSFNITIMRLNADGSEDTGFVAPVITSGVNFGFTPPITDAQTNGGQPFQVQVAAPAGAGYAGALPQADGSVLVYGSFSTLGGQPAAGMARLTNTGAVDLTFNVGAGAEIRSDPNLFPSVQSVTVAADGKLWVTGIFDTFGGRGGIGIARLNSDGSRDTTFAASPVLYTYRFGGSNIVLAGTDTAYLFGNYEPVTAEGSEFPNALIKMKLLDQAIITAQPQSTTVTSGNNAMLSVTLANAGSPTYQWRRNGVNIAGATSSSYQITGARRSDADRYDVVITDGTDTFVSESATVSVAPTAYPGQLAPDATFNPAPLSISTRLYSALPLPDGKWLVAGDFVRWGTTERSFLARLNADYSLDLTFTPPEINQEVYALARAPDGSIYVGGAFNAVDHHEFPGLFRLNPAGQLDLYWRPKDDSPFAAVSALAVQADGKLLVARQSTFLNGQVPVSGTNLLRRLHADGEWDASFTVDITHPATPRIYSLVVDNTTGSVAVGGQIATVNGVTRNGIARVNTFGVLDATFAGVAGGSANSIVFSLTRNADGSYLAGGTFTTMAGVSRNRAAIINADGTLNPTFVPAALNGNVLGAGMQADGKVVLAGTFTTAGGNATYGLVRLAANGGVDFLFAEGGVPGSFASVTQARGVSVFPQADGSIALFGAFQSIFNQRRTGVAVIGTSGLLSSSGSTLVYRPAFTGSVFVQNDKTVVFGSMDTGPGVVGSLGQAARINDDGTFDPAFPQGTGFTLNGLSTFGVYRAIRDANGSFLAVGDLAGYDGNSRTRMVRVGADGAFDGTFNAGTGPSIVFPQIFPLSGGKTLMFPGSSSGFTFAGVSSTILRINPDGTRDTSFVAGSFAPAAPGFAQAGYEDAFGRIYIAGSFNHYAGNPVPGFMRLRPDGSYDYDFAPGFVGSGGIQFITGLPDGRIVVAGSFTTYAGQPANNLVVIFPNGDIDPSFTAPAAINAQVAQVIPQEDGKFLVFGDFSGTPTPFAARLNANGTVDDTFGLHGITAGGGSSIRYVVADDGSIYAHNTPISVNYGVPTALVRFRGAPVAPTIAVAPVGVTTTSGSPVVFTVRANGTGPFTYEWKLNGEIIEEGSNSVISSYSIDPGANGSLTVTVSNAFGSVTSTPVTLTVTNPLIRDQPASRKAVAGGKVIFQVTAGGTGTLTYQWRKDGVDIGGATGSSLTLSNLAGVAAGAYSVVVTDSTGSTTSQDALLTVLTPDNVLWQQFTEFSTEHAPARTIHDSAGRIYVPWSIHDRNPDMVAGRLAGALARFDGTTGTYDPTFKLDRRYRRASHAAIQPDGKILVSVGVGDSNTVIRVDSTGAVDNTFVAPLFARGIRFITRQADGKVILAATDNLSSFAPAGALGAAAPGIYRLNADGSIDSGFTAAALNAAGNVFGPPAVDASGRIYLAGGFNTVAGTGRINVARLNANGTLDTTFAASLPTGWASSQARGVDLQSDGRAVFVGDFRYNTRGNPGDPIMAIRFNTDGTFDTTFGQPQRSNLNMGPVGQRLRFLVMLPGNKIMTVSDRLYLLNADGTPDSEFNNETPPFEREAFWISRGIDGRYFVPDQSALSVESTMLQLWGNGIACFTAEGEPDQSFQTGGFGRVTYPANGRVASDGSVWMGGGFNRFGSTPLAGVAHFTAPGTLAGTQAVVPIASPDNFRAQPFGSVAAAAGDQTYVVWTNNSNTTGNFYGVLHRLNANGTIDGTFAPVLPGGYNLGTAGAFAMPGGKVLLAQGTVAPQAALNGATGDALLQLNTDGTRDTGYTPALSSFATVERDGSNTVTMIRTGGLNVGQVLPDGRVLIVVSAVDGNLRVLRLLANGTIDGSFNAPSFGTIPTSVGFSPNIFDPVKNVTQQFPLTTYSASGLVIAVAQAPNGKVYVGGRFNLDGRPRGLIRLNADGSFDDAFTGAGIATTATDGVPYVGALTVDATGRLYAAGRFTSFNGQAVAGILRLDAMGALDTTWDPGFSVRDVPGANVSLVASGAKLYVFGTAGTAGEPLPSAYRVVDVPAAAMITSQPVSKTVSAGGSVTFTVAATSTGSITYQWRHNGNAIVGATGPSLLLDNVLAAQAGSYSATVSSNGFDVQSASATLTVLGAVSDLSGDGKADLILTNTRTGDRYIWSMNGTTYAGEAYLGSVPGYWRVSGTGDFDRDGKSDLLLTNTQTGDRYIWLMDGTVYRDAVHLGTVPPEWEIGGTGDFNADGYVDIFISNTISGDRYVWLMNGTTYQSDVYIGNEPPAWRVAGVGDFNLDGKPDLLWQNSSTDAGRVWLMNGTVMASEATLSPGGANWQMTGTGDYNADGYSDIVWQNGSTGERRIWLMNGVSLPTSVAIDTLPLDWTLGSAVIVPRAVSGDFNGDGKPDLVLQNRTTGDRYIWLMNGTAYSDAAYVGNIGPDWDIAGKGDFNGDGKTDLVWQNTVTGDRYVWLMNGTTYVSEVYLGNVPPSWDIAGTGDFNSDGKSDLILQNNDTGDRYVWLMNGTTYAGEAYLGRIGPDWRIAGSADFNQDGKADLIWQNRVTGDRYIWTMNGTTYTGEAYLGTVPTDWDLAGAADYSGDGKPDLVLQNTVTGDRYIWTMNGTTYTGEAYLGFVGPAWRIVR